MPKLKAPLLSFNARGRLSKLFSLARRGGRNIIERRPIPTDAKSPAQLFNRHMFTKCVDLWHLLSNAEKQEWESLARPRHMTGYAWFISQCLRPNPGIYLPLQGGTMSGNIDMAKNRLLELPEPTDAQEAMRNTLTNGKIWQGNAANKPAQVDPPVPEAPTKEFFAPITYATHLIYHNYHPCAWVYGSTNEAAIELYIPHDFTSITAAVVVRAPRATATHRLNYFTFYGAQGEVTITHQGTLLDQDTAETEDIIYEQDISAMLTNLAAGDYAGIRVLGDTTNTPNDSIFGLRFKYS